MRRFVSVLLLSLGLPFAAPANADGQARPQASLPRQATPEPARRVLQVGQVTEIPPVVDGRLDEPVWQTAELASGFTQFAPQPGAPATERTEVQVLYSTDAIYVGMRIHESAPDSIVAQLARRDAPGIYSDWASVLIDSYNDHRTAFQFSVNPRGVKRDVFHFDDTRQDMGWDAVWDVATQMDSLGWTAEFRIPLSQLRFNTGTREGEEYVWGINFSREIARNEEKSFWAAVMPNAGRVVSLFGELHGLRDIRSPRRLEVLPYSLTRLTRAPGDAKNPFYAANDLAGSLGADIKYGITSDLTLSATLNPDFGQVEADPSEVNLTTFESFFPERRPFFTEGADIFRFGLGVEGGSVEQLFYSRRIGRAPQRRLRVPGGFVDAPESARILGAGKLSGKTASGWSIGVLNALTAPTDAQVVDSLGMLRSEPVEPMTNYGVARVMKDFRRGQSMMGGIFTATNRQLDDVRLQSLRSAAYTGGLDLRHRFGGGNYQVSGWILGSRIEGSESAIAAAQRSAVRYFHRPDAAHVKYDPTRTSLTGLAATATVGKVGGGNLTWEIFSGARSPEFEVNDLGFQQIADVAFVGGAVGYNQFRAGAPFRRWGVRAMPVAGWTFGGEPVQRSALLSGHFQLLNSWGGSGAIFQEFGALSPFHLRGGGLIAQPAKTNFFFGFHTDRRRPLSLALNGNASLEAETDGRAVGLQPAVTFRPTPRAEFSLQPGISWNNNPWQYVQTSFLGGEPRYVFGKLDQTTTSLTTRMSYTVTPTLSLQLYMQPFISGGSYSEFRQVVDPRASRFQDRFHTFTRDELLQRPEGGPYSVDLDGSGTADFSFRNPDFSMRQFRSNAVLRWEYRPGSTIFVVWSQGRNDFHPDGSPGLWHDVNQLREAQPTNVLLIKASYWLGL